MPQFEQIEVFHSLIFWSLISFAILFFLLKKFAFPPILEVLEERESKIRSEIGDAEKLRQEAEGLKADLGRELKNAHEKAQTIIQMAGDESKKIQGYFSQIPELKHFKFNVKSKKPKPVIPKRKLKI